VTQGAVEAEQILPPAAVQSLLPQLITSVRQPVTMVWLGSAG